MRARSAVAVAAVLAGCLAVSRVRAEEAAALDAATAAREARLAALEGKFREADLLLERAPPEVQNDAALHLAIADMAMKFARANEGAAQREGFRAARDHFARAVDVKPSDGRAAAGAILAAKELADLDVAAKMSDKAKEQAKFAIELGEKALAGGVADPEFKIQLGRMYGMRASFVKTMKEVELLASDSMKAAKLLGEGAAATDNPKLLSEASAIQLNAANLIHEQIPVDTEKRDDLAMTSAIEMASLSCQRSGASESDYAAQLRALGLAYRWGIKVATKPFMQPLTPPLSGLKLEISRSGAWTRTKSAADWELDLERDLKDPTNFGVVQVSFVRLDPKEPIMGKTWGQLPEVAQRLFEADVAGLETVGHKLEPVQLTTKAGLDIWHFEAGGQIKGGRSKRIGQWVGFLDKKQEKAIQLRMYDWRLVPDFKEPDIVAFVASLLGEGVWPPDAAAQAKEPTGKDKKPKKK